MLIKEEIKALTGLRFYAALFVLFFHLNADFIVFLFPDYNVISTFLFYSGWTGVDLFFILSGFILCYNYEKEFQDFTVQKYRVFLTKRLARIYPVHIFTFVLLAIPASMKLFEMSSGKYNLSSAQTFETIFLLQAWAFPSNPGWNVVSWSVSAEWLAYLFFPLLLMFITKNSTQKNRMRLIVSLFLSIPLIAGLYHYITFPTSRLIIAPPNMGLLRIAAEFPMGMLIYYIHKNMKTNKKVIPQTATIIIILSLFTPLSFLWAIPVYGYIILLISQNRFFFSGFLSKPISLYGGKLSYSIYLVHGVVVILYKHFVPLDLFLDASNFSKLLYVFSYLAITLMVSIFTYHIVEEKLRKLIIRMLIRH